MKSFQEIVEAPENAFQHACRLIDARYLMFVAGRWFVAFQCYSFDAEAVVEAVVTVWDAARLGKDHAHEGSK